jgi:hypothetical protein
MNWAEAANELSNPAVVIPAALIIAAGSAVGLRRWMKSRENRDDYRRADEIVNHTKVTRIRIPGYSDDPH